jgi:4-amino-4-deoxy-L-arabinose transferase-like glycosyltransferase
MGSLEGMLPGRIWRRLAVATRGDVGLLVMIGTLLVVGGFATAYKLSLVRGNDDIGHADEAAYVEVADSLIHGRGFDVNYVSFFFKPYGREITHREDHWPPLLSLTIAPFLGLFGNTPFTARVAPILIGSFGLPLVTAWLGWVFSRRSYVGLLTGLCMMGNRAMFNDSMRTMADVATAAVVTGFLASVLASRERPRAHLAGGLFVAAGFYVKGSLLMLVGLYPLLALIVSGRHVLRSRWLHAGFAGAVVLISPWLVSNLHCYGNPLYSTQTYVSGALGVQALDAAFLKPYWGKDLPRVSDRWEKDPVKYRQYARANRGQITLYSIMGPSTNLQAWSDIGPIGADLERLLSGTPRLPGRSDPKPKPIWKWQEPMTSLCGIAAVLFILLLIASAIAAAFATRARRALIAVFWDRCIGGPAFLRPTLAILLFLLVYWGFMAYLWRVMPRFSYPLLPSLAVIGCTGASRLIEAPLDLLSPKWARRFPTIAAAGIAASILFALVAYGGALRSHWTPRDRLVYEDFRRQKAEVSYSAVGRWIEANLPGAVVMSRNPWELLYYCGPSNKTVNIPYADPGDIFSVARYYRVTHYLDDQQRAGMESFLTGEHPGMVPVPGAPGRLFALDYARLPDSGLTGASSP